MATLEPVAAGFIVIPSRDRERSYLAFYRDRGETALPLDDALYELRMTDEGLDVVLLPLRSWDAARRVQKAFEKGAKEHEKAERERRRFAPV